MSGDDVAAREAAMIAFRHAFTEWSSRGGLGTGLFICGWQDRPVDPAFNDNVDYLAGRRAARAYARAQQEPRP